MEERKEYQTPSVTKVEFDFSDRIAAYSGCLGNEGRGSSESFCAN